MNDLSISDQRQSLPHQLQKVPQRFLASAMHDGTFECVLEHSDTCYTLVMEQFLIQSEPAVNDFSE